MKILEYFKNFFKNEVPESKYEFYYTLNTKRMRFQVDLDTLFNSKVVQEQWEAAKDYQTTPYYYYPCCRCCNGSSGRRRPSEGGGGDSSSNIDCPSNHDL